MRTLLSNMGFAVVYAFMYLLSLLPFRILYGISGLLYFIVFKILQYRRKVVRQNLLRSFPEKVPEEIEKIHEAFNRYFCDLIVETVKILSITPNALRKRVVFENEEIFSQYLSEGKSLILVCGHHGNWELIGAAFAPLPVHQLFVIYHPLKNRIFDKLLYHMRTRLGNGLYTMKGTLRGMLANRGKITATAFIADQTPSNPDQAYWTSFMGQDTPIFTGTEKLARKLDYPVIFMSIRRPSRGHYQVTAEILSEVPSKSGEGEISEMHTRRLEQDIRAQPEIWLWTHRRWKHQRPSDHLDEPI